MNIKITDKAVSWFENEMGLEPGDGVHFFGKVYGKTEIHEGFSVGMRIEKPDSNLLGKVKINGITYFASKEDDWFFSRYDLVVDYDDKKEEPIYHFNAKE
ncbi:iron-sulfur cluster biosynthesis protein [Alkalibacterium kapii]|uniref:Iron-sulfur cluster biosynthesis protein n=1 Tax=Alkalibacterium kapii TaxID=426704 RepID=A0A511AUK8_9LACT|nr:iron-sulfur cluster biosynthesis protein [Alkalibacterium kapii]GEK91879.1 iron-sulfur cluster biosynthesis protein [Alkalibacterium kapii]